MQLLVSTPVEGKSTVSQQTEASVERPSGERSEALQHVLELEGASTSRRQRKVVQK